MNRWQRYRYWRRLIGPREARRLALDMTGYDIMHATVCRVLGHRWELKMRDRVCARCRTSEPR